MHPGPNKEGTRGHPSAHEPKPKQCCEQCRCPVEKIWRELNPGQLPLFRIRGEKVKAGADTAPTASRARPGWDRDRDKATCLSPCLKGPSPAPCPLSTRGPGAAPGSGHSSPCPASWAQRPQHLPSLPLSPQASFPVPHALQLSKALGCSCSPHGHRSDTRTTVFGGKEPAGSLLPIHFSLFGVMFGVKEPAREEAA